MQVKGLRCICRAGCARSCREPASSLPPNYRPWPRADRRIPGSGPVV